MLRSMQALYMHPCWAFDKDSDLCKIFAYTLRRLCSQTLQASTAGDSLTLGRPSKLADVVQLVGCSMTVVQSLACRQYARTLGEAFDKREDLRKIIAQALERLCTQSRQALQAAGVNLSHSQPPKMASFGEDEDADADAADADAAVEVPESYTLEVAKRCVWYIMLIGLFCIFIACASPATIAACERLLYVWNFNVSVSLPRFAQRWCPPSQPTVMKHSCLQVCRLSGLSMYVHAFDCLFRTRVHFGTIL